jgi:hypothetical protein
LFTDFLVGTAFSIPKQKDKGVLRLQGCQGLGNGVPGTLVLQNFKRAGLLPVLRFRSALDVQAQELRLGSKRADLW